MEEKSSTEEKVVVNTEKRDGGAYDDYSCSNILLCKYPLHEVVKAIFFKCFGFETSHEAAGAESCSTPDVKEIEPSTTEPLPIPSSTPGPTVPSEDVTMRFRPPPKLQPSKGSGPETNSTGNS